MAEERLIGLAVIIALGIAAQWLAWRLRWPSILLLLVTGFVAGPVMRGIAPEFSLNPDFIFGGLLFPIVSMAVAIILFEGGLTLKLSELPQAGGVMWRLVTIGALVTWVIAGAAAHLIFGFSWSLSLLLAAILVVTGPTVIAPLLSHIRPQGIVGPILKWEGIVIDPIGATLTVLLYEAVVIGAGENAPTLIILGVLKTLISGTGAGLLGAAFLILPMRRHWIPDDLQNGVALAVVVTTFVAANQVQHESGLLAVVVMGVALANQKWVPIHHITEFKENLRVLLLSGLFILLSARLAITDLTAAGYAPLLFLAVLILIARPLSVIFATMGSRLTGSERLFLAWMAPRGIVAAAIASIFSLRLQANNIAGAEQLAPITVIVIVGTVMVYGLSAPALARKLKIVKPPPRGVLIAGAHEWARKIAMALQAVGQTVRLVDTDRTNVDAAREQDLSATHASVQSPSILEAADREGLGVLLAVTSNDEVNALACMRFASALGRARIFQLPPREAGHRRKQAVAEEQHGRLLFDEKATYHWLDAQFDNGAKIVTAKLTEAYSFEDFQEEHNWQLLPLFTVSETGELTILTSGEPPTLRAPQNVIALALPEAPPSDKVVKKTSKAEAATFTP
jgi:NhaP-type Na+/H+ or K+/H+ antiporter